MSAVWAWTWEAHLCAKAVADAADLGDAVLLLEDLDGLLDDGVDVLLGMGVLAVRALCEPVHDVHVTKAGWGDGVAVEEIGHQGQVAVGSELVGNELRVAPDADSVGQQENGRVLVRLALCRRGYIGVVLAHLGPRAGRFTPRRELSVWCPGSTLGLRWASRGPGTYSCLTPIVQHLPGGLEAIVIE
jgi:hypothetical protein